MEKCLCSFEGVCYCEGNMVSLLTVKQLFEFDSFVSENLINGIESVVKFVLQNVFEIIVKNIISTHPIHKEH